MTTNALRPNTPSSWLLLALVLALAYAVIPLFGTGYLGYTVAREWGKSRQ